MTEPVRGVQVRTSFYADPEDPDGPALFKVEIWPLPQEIGKQIFLELYEHAKELCRQAGFDGPETNLDTPTQGPAH